MENIQNDNMEEKEPVEMTAEQVAKVCDEIRQRLSPMNPRSIALEILKYLASSVENYVDSKETDYMIPLWPADDPPQAELLPMTLALQKAYLDIPQVPSPENDPNLTPQEKIAVETFDYINDQVTSKVKDILMGVDEEIKQAKTELFKRLIFFYEMTGISVQTRADGSVVQAKPLTHSRDGYVEFTEFVYEPISLDQKIYKVMKKVNPDGTLSKAEGQEKVLDRIVHVPESFVLCMSLVSWPATSGMSLPSM